LLGPDQMQLRKKAFAGYQKGRKMGCKKMQHRLSELESETIQTPTLETTFDMIQK